MRWNLGTLIKPTETSSAPFLLSLFFSQKNVIHKQKIQSLIQSFYPFPETALYTRHSSPPSRWCLAENRCRVSPRFGNRKQLVQIFSRLIRYSLKRTDSLTAKLGVSRQKFRVFGKKAFFHKLFFFSDVTETNCFFRIFKKLREKKTSFLKKQKKKFLCYKTVKKTCYT